MHLSFIMNSDRAAVTGWRYLWAKHVVGFKPSCHCAGCLKGTYDPRFGLATPAGQMINLWPYAPGAILYFCGVATPYRWANNLHLPVRVTGDPQDMASARCYNGDELTIAGATEILFTDKEARRDHPSRGPEFLTCRNFQLGATLRAAGII